MMLYKENTSAGDLVDIDKPAAEWSIRDITLGLGIANWHEFNGDAKIAEMIHRKILATAHWNYWAYAVTEKRYAD